MSVCQRIILAAILVAAVPGVTSAATINFALNGTATASNTYLPAFAPEMAIDDLAGTTWNAGNYPEQWIEIDLGASLPISEIQGLVAQLPNGNTVHNIYLDGTLAFTWAQFTSDFDLLTHAFASPLSAQVVRVTTTSSPSWVGWREIRVLGEAPAAVTEPATLVLLGAGLAGIGLARRGRRRR